MLELLEEEEHILRVHKSYFANLKKVESFSSEKIEIKGTSIPISRKQPFRRQMGFRNLHLWILMLIHRQRTKQRNRSVSIIA